MYKCYGCGRDLCGIHAVYQELLLTHLVDCNYLCKECDVSFVPARNEVSVVMAEAYRKREEIINAWKTSCERDATLAKENHATILPG
jgi:hypothetical protein